MLLEVSILGLQIATIIPSVLVHMVVGDKGRSSELSCKRRDVTGLICRAAQDDSSRFSMTKDLKTRGVDCDEVEPSLQPGFDYWL